MENVTMTNLFGVLMVLGVVAFLVWTFLQYRTVLALTMALQSVGQNTKVLDLIENMAVKVVPADLVRKIDSTAEWLKQFTPDEIDMLIDAGRSLLDKVTDGQPNEPEPPTTTDGVG